MVQSCFPSLAASPLSAASRGAFAPTWPTSSQQTRVGVSRPRASGRLSRRVQVRPTITPGSRPCAYRTASGRRNWLNRDPIGERGGLNLFGFVENSPTTKSDAYGLDVAGPYDVPISPPKWNPKEWMKGRENCCAYAYDRPGKSLQPGELGGMSKYPDFSQGGYTCAEITKRIIADFPNNPNVGAPKGGKCPDGTHKVKPWVVPNGRGYHMQRQDDDGKWSDMPSPEAPKRCSPNKPDVKGDIPCGEICVPNSAR